MADQVDRANEIEGQSTDREVRRIEADSIGAEQLVNGDVVPHADRDREIAQRIKEETSIRPKKPLPRADE